MTCCLTASHPVYWSPVIYCKRVNSSGHKYSPKRFVVSNPKVDTFSSILETLYIEVASTKKSRAKKNVAFNHYVRRVYDR